jgi:alkylation response protein AidB-like acyl-CoA dehydrogenase
MDVLLDEDERAVLEPSRAFLSSACSPSVVRASEAQQQYSPELWKELVRLGWLDTSLPESAGGLGLPVHYLALLFEELGRHIAPVPFLSVMVPALVLARYGSARHAPILQPVREGGLLLSFALQEEGGAWSADAIRMRGHVEADALVLNGTKMFVEDFASSSRCLVAFRAEGANAGLSLALVDTSSPGITHEALVPLAKDSHARVRFDDVRVPLADVVGELGQGAEPLANAMDLASLFCAAQMTGAARKATEMAVEWANQRIAFEQPLGAFQAVQHLCSEMLIVVDGAQLLFREAAWKLGQGLDAGVEISQAKSFANEKCLMACRSAQQLHGGMGFMMEFDLQLWYRRVASWSLRYGSTSEHRRRIADGLLGRSGKRRLDGFPAL